MDICQTYKVFLQRNGKLLMFEKNGVYDGDSLNIERYINKGSVRYIFISKEANQVKQTLYYFAKTSDQYITQFGEWVHIQECFDLPEDDVVKFLLKDYYTDGQYTKETKIITRKDGEFKVTLL